MKKILGIIIAFVLFVGAFPVGTFVNAASATPQKNSDGYYKLYTADDLFWFASLVNGTLTDSTAQNTAACAILMNDIVINDIEVDSKGISGDTANLRTWVPIGSSSSQYIGTFDGNGFTIKGVYIEDSDGLYANESTTTHKGMFGVVENATILNFSLVDTYISAGSYVGLVCGSMNGGTISNVNVDGVASGHNSRKSGSVTPNWGSIGGICGISYTGSIELCTNSAYIHGDSYIGGIVGCNVDANIKYCTNYGEVNNVLYGGHYAGGIAGRNAYSGFSAYKGTGDILNCANYGKIKSTSEAGGICARTGSSYESENATTVSNCNNYGDVYSDYYVGGIAAECYSIITNCNNFGSIVSTYNYAGGICSIVSGSSYRYSTYVSNSNNFGLVSGVESVGGVSGVCKSYASITNCSNSGDVTGETRIGGVCGSTIGIISGCENNGQVTGTDQYIGGLVGYNNGTLSDSDNNGNVTGDDCVGGISGYNSDTATVENCRNYGTVTGNTNYGDIIGADDGSTVNSYFEPNPKYEILAKYYPEYLNQSVINDYFSIGLDAAGDVIESYSSVHTGILAYLDCFKNGSKVIAREVLSLLGVQSNEEKWLEDATIEYLEAFKKLDPSVIETAYKEVKDIYDDAKLVYEATENLTRLNLIDYVCECSEHLTYSTVEDIVDSAIDDIDKLGGIEKFSSTAFDIADIVIYAAQIYDIEMELIDKLMAETTEDSTLYKGLSIIKAQKEAGAAYVVGEYICEEVVSKASKVFTKIGAVPSISYGATNAIVSLTYGLLYDNLVEVKITDIYQGIVLYDFYTSASIMSIDKLNELLLCKINDTEPSDELMNDYRWFWNAKVTSFDVYLDACKTLAKTSAEYSLLNRIQTDAKTNLNFDSYINYCYSVLQNDIREGKADCMHKFAYIGSSEESSCTSASYDVYECPDCLQCFSYKTEDVQGHTFTTASQAATCAVSGYTKYTCSACGYAYSEYTEPTGHNYVDNVVAPDCCNQGYTEHTCSVCGYQYIDNVIEASGHSCGEPQIATQPSCDSEGQLKNECSVCEETILASIEELEHDFQTEYTTDVFPNNGVNGVKSYHCNDCSATYDDTEIPCIEISKVSLVLYSDLSLEFKVSEDYFESFGYTEPYMFFELNGNQRTVTDYTVSNGLYIFKYKNIQPDWINETVTATLYATYDGQIVASEQKQCSVADYCYTVLEKYNTDDYAELRTLVVDLLNYGAASQQYTGYDTENLCNALLTEEQKLYGTSQVGELTSVLDKNYQVVENPQLTFKSVGLNLQSAISVRIGFISDDIENMRIKVLYDDVEQWYDFDDFVLGDNDRYYIYVNSLNASHVSENLLFTAYSGDTPVSNTLCYSIESYASTAYGGSDELLSELVAAMMNYGRSAYQYIN